MKDSPPPSHSCLALCQLQLGVFRNGGKLNGFRISWALWLLVRSRNPGSLIVRTRLFGFKSRIPFFLAPYFPALFSSVSIIRSALIMLSFPSLNQVLQLSYWGSGGISGKLILLILFLLFISSQYESIHWESLFNSSLEHWLQQLIENLTLTYFS